MTQLKQRLIKAKAQHLERIHPILDPTLINFASNDYLGMAYHPRVIQALREKAKNGIGSSSSALVCGYTKEQQYLEDQLKDFLGYAKVLIFNSGYMANLGIISTLANATQSVLIDKLAHSSLIDAVQLSKAGMIRFFHNDMNHLNHQLAKTVSHNSLQPALIVTEGLFSMDGDVCPIKDLISLSNQYNVPLMIDDAHGFGVLGEFGQGITSHHTPKDVPILMGTFSKAIGTMGAFVATTDEYYDYLLQFARPYIYTTALPACIISATSESLKCLQEETHILKKLRENIHHFTECAKSYDLSILNKTITSSDSISTSLSSLSSMYSPIQAIVLKDAQRALSISEQLKKKGFLVHAMRPPTVPPGTSRLRITLNALHDKKMIRNLVQTLAEVIHN